MSDYELEDANTAFTESISELRAAMVTLESAVANMKRSTCKAATARARFHAELIRNGYLVSKLTKHVDKIIAKYNK